MAIASITLPDLVPGQSTGYPAFLAQLATTYSQLAAVMSISVPSFSTIALGQGDPVGDANKFKALANQLVAAVNALAPGAVTDYNFIIGGDSRPANIAGVTSGDSMQEQVGLLLGFTWTNPTAYSYAGDTVAQFHSRNVAAIKAAYSSTLHNIVIVWCGTNGLYRVGLDQTKTDTQSVATDLLNTPTTTTVIWLPEPNRQDFYKTATFEADRLAYNAFLKNLAAATPNLLYLDELENEPAFFATTSFLARLYTQPDATTLTPVAGASAIDNKTISREGIHLLPQGSRGLAYLLAAALANRFSFASIVPDGPVAYADDTANTLEYRHILGATNLEVLTPGAAYAPAASLYNVGAGNVAIGSYKARTVAKAGRLVSAITPSPAFTDGSANVFAALYGQATPTLSADRVTSQENRGVGPGFDWQQKAVYRQHVDRTQGQAVFVIPGTRRAGNATLSFFNTPATTSQTYESGVFSVYLGDSAPGNGYIGILQGSQFLSGPTALPDTPIRVIISPTGAQRAVVFYNDTTGAEITSIATLPDNLFPALTMYQNGSEMFFPTISGAGWVS